MVKVGECLKKTKMKFNGSVCAIVFYTIAGILLLYGAYMIFAVYQYLITYYEQYGTTMQAELSNTVQYFISNCSPYFIDAVLCYGIGTIIQMLHGLKSAQQELLNNDEEHISEANDIV